MKKDENKTKQNTVESEQASNSQQNHPEIGADTIITLDFKWEDIAPAYQRSLDNVAKGMKMPGFRPGKVPSKIAEAQVDPERLAQKTLQKLLPEAYEAEIVAQKIAPIIQPEFILIKCEKGQDWQVEAHLAVKPEIKLGDYKKALITNKNKAIKEIEKQEKEKAAAAKKAAIKPKKDGEKAPVVEMEPSLPALTTEQIDSQAMDQAIMELRNDIKPILPEILVKKQAQQQLQEMLDQLKQFGIELDDYLKNTGNTFENLANDITGEALKKLQLDFIMQAMMDAEKIDASPEEIHAEFNRIFAEHAQNHAGHQHAEGEKCKAEEDLAAIQAEREADPYYITYVTDVVRRKKLVEFLQNLK